MNANEKYDPNDTELKALMGEHFYDETAQPRTAAEAAAMPTDTTAEEKAAHSPASGPAKAKAKGMFESVKFEPTFFDNLKASAKSALTFGGLNILIFYWAQAGLMDASVAVPSMCVCAALAGYGVGKAFAKECRR